MVDLTGDFVAINGDARARAGENNAGDLVGFPFYDRGGRRLKSIEGVLSEQLNDRRADGAGNAMLTVTLGNLDEARGLGGAVIDAASVERANVLGEVGPRHLGHGIVVGVETARGAVT